MILATVKITKRKIVDKLGTINILINSNKFVFTLKGMIIIYTIEKQI